MTFLLHNIIKIVMFLLCSVALHGCATADKRVNILYQPTAQVKGGSGDLYLVQGVQSPSTQAAGVQWVLGEVKKDDGQKKAKIVTDTAPAHQVLDALSRELSEAGYRVITAESLPAGVEKGVVLKEVVINLDDVYGTFSDEVNCSARMALQPWRKGAAVNTLQYQAESMESAVSDRDRLPAKVLQKTLQLLMSRSAPEIVRIMEQK